MPLWYVVTNDGQQRGPVSENDVLALVKQGHLGSHSPCWTDGLADWTTIAQVPQFAAAVKPEGGEGAAFMNSIRQTIDKGKRKIEVTRLRMRISKLRKTREEWINKMGERIYQSCTSSGDPLGMDQEIRAVADCEKEIGQTEQEIARIENQP